MFLRDNMGIQMIKFSVALVAALPSTLVLAEDFSTGSAWSRPHPGDKGRILGHRSDFVKASVATKKECATCCRKCCKVSAQMGCFTMAHEIRVLTGLGRVMDWKYNSRARISGMGLPCGTCTYPLLYRSDCILE